MVYSSLCFYFIFYWNTLLNNGNQIYCFSAHWGNSLNNMWKTSWRPNEQWPSRFSSPTKPQMHCRVRFHLRRLLLCGRSRSLLSPEYGQKWWGPGCSGWVLPSSITAATHWEAGVTKERMHTLLKTWYRYSGVEQQKNNWNETGWWVQSHFLSFHS